MDLFMKGLGIYAIITLVWYILQVIADWKILSKAGRPGWLSLIPIVNVFEEYDICWSGWIGLVYLILPSVATYIQRDPNASSTMTAIAGALGLIALIIHAVQSFRLAKSFGHGPGYGILLLLFGPIMRMILGLGDSEYIGNF